MTETLTVESDAPAVEAALRKRLDDWFRSTSETYAQPVGSPAWRDGLVSYLMHGPGSLSDRDIPPGSGNAEQGGEG